MKQKKRSKTGVRQGDSLTYSRLHRLLAGLVLRLFRIRVHYPEHEPDSGNYLLCCNHISAMDPVVLAAALRKRQPHFMAKKELFRIPLLSGLLRAINAFPVDRSGGDVAAIKATVALIENGDCVGVFPQGTRRPGQAPGLTADTVKGGVGLLCERTHVRVLPVCLKTKSNRLRLFGGADLIIGQPMDYEQLIGTDAEAWQSMRRQDRYEAVAQTIFARICALYEEGVPHEKPE